MFFVKTTLVPYLSIRTCCLCIYGKELSHAIYLCYEACFTFNLPSRATLVSIASRIPRGHQNVWRW